MTTREKLEEMLINRGMSSRQAKQVMDIAVLEIGKTTESDWGYNITFNRPCEEYPKPIYLVLFLEIKPIALKWINENIPNAWYKNLFEK